MKLNFLKPYSKFIVLIWAIFIMLFAYQLNNKLPFVETVILVLSLFIPYYIESSFLTNYVLPKAIARKHMKLFILKFAVYTVLMAIFYALTCQLYYYLEMEGYINLGDLFAEKDTFIDEVLSACFTFSLFNTAFCGLRFYYEHAMLEKVHLESQLQMLQAQVNPHFMFNVLNHIHILIRKDVDLASFLLEKYSEILRYQLYNSKQEYVPLKQEIQFLKDVSSIEKLRWGEDLDVESIWEVENGNEKIQPLLLIAFIENAFKHTSRSMTDKGYIKLYLKQHGNSIFLSLENSKSKYAEEKKSASGLGLKNTKERLEILYPHKHKLTITETDWTYKIELSITLK